LHLEVFTGTELLHVVTAARVMVMFVYCAKHVQTNGLALRQDKDIEAVKNLQCLVMKDHLNLSLNFLTWRVLVHMSYATQLSLEYN
jgi:hypothetical protein